MSKIKNKFFSQWLSIATEINHSLPNVPVLNCPNCHQQEVDFQFVGDLQTRIGYMAIWCPFCLHGIHLSRVLIPAVLEANSFDISIEEVSKRIPNFTHVEP
ncbi:MAG: hypothetical protein RMZ41_016305 [Nostoc sp. DedVER02]|uniref:hypothetical protein n=1 Tax=unclassified Nostoc TaxID=2593658 RepID=UPI002AD3664E|nr:MULTISPECIES: hypothetical protein [unclassified Nostoc]MDZ7988414.1 hypothetical protein [Nostoc sp. DedVER02]MDZ8112152.1 hypothetical protein [Nostoc sp. DedVER01b]